MYTKQHENPFNHSICFVLSEPQEVAYSPEKVFVNSSHQRDVASVAYNRGKTHLCATEFTATVYQPACLMLLSCQELT